MNVEELFRKLEGEAFCSLCPEISKIFTKKRIEILKLVEEEKPGSIRDLARIADRDIKNIFQDLKCLKKNGIISFKKEGRKKRPVLKHKYLVISFKKEVKKNGRK